MEPTDRDAELQKLREAEESMRKLQAEMGLPVSTQPRPADEPPLCSFCGAGRNNVRFMFSGKHEGVGPPVFICADCIEVAQNMMSQS
jgi:ClpX C4-type zinc finger protein